MHDNRFIPDPEPKQAHGNAAYEETAIILEQRTQRTLIERNSISGYNQALYFNIREGVYDFTFRSNFCVQLGGDAGSMFRMDGHGDGISITGNAVGNTSWNWLVIDDYIAIDSLTVQDNIRFNTGGESLLRSLDDVSGYTCSGNSEVAREEWNLYRKQYLAQTASAQRP